MKSMRTMLAKAVVGFVRTVAMVAVIGFLGAAAKADAVYQYTGSGAVDVTASVVVQSPYVFYASDSSLFGTVDEYGLIWSGGVLVGFIEVGV